MNEQQVELWGFVNNPLEARKGYFCISPNLFSDFRTMAPRLMELLKSFKYFYLRKTDSLFQALPVVLEQ